MPLSRDLREFIECLNSNEAEYLVVGAFAVSWHGFPRYSGDIDFLVRPTPENAALVLRAIADFGMGSLGISVDDLAVPGKVVQLGFEPNPDTAFGPTFVMIGTGYVAPGFPAISSTGWMVSLGGTIKF